LQNFYRGFTVREAVNPDFPQLDIQALGDFLSQLGVGIAGENQKIG